MMMRMQLTQRTLIKNRNVTSRVTHLGSCAVSSNDKEHKTTQLTAWTFSSDLEAECSRCVCLEAHAVDECIDVVVKRLP